jgi:hypothetical protein
MEFHFYAFYEFFVFWVKGFFVWDLGALLEILIGFQPTKSIKKLT